MKRLIIVLVLLAGSVGTVNAAQTIVAGPLTVDVSGTSEYNILLCSAFNLSDETKTYNLALINSTGLIVSGAAGQTVDSLQTLTSSSSQAQLCVWEVGGNPENWRFTACTARNPNLACTGGALEGRVAPGMKFPE